MTGEESYRTDVTVANIGDLPASAVLYRAGDCFLQNTDLGFGSADHDDRLRVRAWPASTGRHRAREPASSNGSRCRRGATTSRTSTDNVWAAIGTQAPFADSCAECTTYDDNGAGLSWNLTVPPADR